MVERTFVMLKPIAVSRGLVGSIISRFESKGLRIAALKLVRVQREMAEKLYAVHFGKPFYQSLIDSISGKDVVVAILEGRSAIEVVRLMIGATDPVKASPGTIRGDYGLDITNNIIHASDSPDSYEYEHRIFFSPEEILD
ncbi:Nucleoside diphosphate kinase [Candidatus Calditenuaceae archaeon HR02]|nr:Nucleoside diphosphate kinase [Candidatus Calditenuaceae archaeon HR02]